MTPLSRYPELKAFLGLTSSPVNTEDDEGDRILFGTLLREIKHEPPIHIQTMGAYIDRVFAALGIPKGTLQAKIKEKGLSPGMHNFPEDVLGLSRMITVATKAMVKLAEHIEELDPAKRDSAAELIFRLAKERCTKTKTAEILDAHHQQVCEALGLPIN